MIAEKRWKLHAQNQEVADKLATTLNISPVIAQLLLNRNITTLNQAIDFLAESPKETQFQIEKLDSLYAMIKALML